MPIETRITYSRSEKTAYRAAFDGSNNVFYEGWARVGYLTSQAKWQICRHTYDVNNNLTATEWADGTDEPTKIWNERASYVYS